MFRAITSAMFEETDVVDVYSFMPLLFKSQRAVFHLKLCAKAMTQWLQRKSSVPPLIVTLLLNMILNKSQFSFFKVTQTCGNEWQTCSRLYLSCCQGHHFIWSV